MSWRSAKTYEGRYQQFITEACDIVKDATMADGRSSILGQRDLCERLGCSATKLTAAMPDIVEISTRMWPGYCLQTGWGHKLDDGRRVKMYRIVNEQNGAEIRTSRGRLLNGLSRIERARSEIAVELARPGARAAAALMDAGIDLQERAIRELDTVEI
jgi:hypothetical protein